MGDNVVVSPVYKVTTLTTAADSYPPRPSLERLSLLDYYTCLQCGQLLEEDDAFCNLGCQQEYDECFVIEEQ